MRGNVAEEKRSGSLKTSSQEKSGADKPAKPLSHYFRKVSTCVYGWWTGKERKQVSYFSQLWVSKILCFRHGAEQQGQFLLSSEAR